MTTPYRRQADKVTDALIDSIESDTVHKFQGREKDAVVMTRVLDDTLSSRAALEFADDPKLINVSVSRAMRLFVLVTHPSDSSSTTGSPTRTCAPSKWTATAPMKLTRSSSPATH
ncbi:AAA domain-containing protein [Nocardia sp. R6R-6]|uniref:AAA domain-containing protein n=1 Tax=Nocardia sp. R6R-6 TaxID=3459303 RepID=UPI00403DCDF4